MNISQTFFEYLCVELGGLQVAKIESGQNIDIYSSNVHQSQQR